MAGLIMAEQNQSGRIDKSNFALLFAVMLVTGAGNTALQSIIPAIGRTLRIPDSLIATIFSVSALIWVYSAPYWARQSEERGRRRLVLIGLGGFTISTALVATILFVALSTPIDAALVMVMIILARAIFGFFGSAAPPASQAIVVLATPKAQRTKALTLLSSAFGLGTLLGLSLAPWMVLPIVSFAGPPISFTLLGGLVWLLAVRKLKDAEDHGGEVARGAKVSYPSLGGAPAGAAVTAATSPKSKLILKLRDPRIWPWMMCGIILGHAQAMSGASMGFLVIDRLGLDVSLVSTQQMIGLVLMAGAGAALLVQWGIIPRLDMQPKAMMVTGIGFAIAGLIANAAAGSLYGIAMSYALASIGFGFTRPAFTAGSSLAVGRSLQGVVAGHVTSINGLSFVIAPTLGVGLYEFWMPLPFLVSALAMAALLPYALLKLKPLADDQPTLN
jgi:MFS family permease